MQTNSISEVEDLVERTELGIWFRRYTGLCFVKRGALYDFVFPNFCISSPIQSNVIESGTEQPGQYRVLKE